jgi:hypothetical protein
MELAYQIHWQGYRRPATAAQRRIQSRQWRGYTKLSTQEQAQQVQFA